MTMNDERLLLIVEDDEAFSRTLIRSFERRLSSHDASMRIVVLTGFASIATAVEAIKLGACHYLAKPSNTDDIEAACARADGDAEVGLTERQTASIKTLEWAR